MEPSTRFRLGRVLPLILLLTAAADLVCRAVPPQAIAFRAWEAMSSHPSTTGPFRASARFETTSAYGDLASTANLPQHRHYFEERFSTDVHGCRNPAKAPAPEILVVGDSFAAGCAVSDDESLPAVLEKQTGRGVYCAAGFPPDLDEIRAAVRHSGMTRGVVVYEHAVRLGDPQPFRPSRNPFSKPVRRMLQSWVDYSPLKIWCMRAHRRLEDGRLLTNSAARDVVLGTLPSGDTILFLRFEVEMKRKLEDADRAALHWQGLAAELKKDGLDLVVVLVPGKSTIYGPLTREGLDVSGARAFIGRMQDRLLGLGVPALDLSPVLERAARERLADGTPLYRLDDTHWTPEGHRVAAAAIAGLLESRR